jgi:small subunit ribosomal protein S20
MRQCARSFSAVDAVVGKYKFRPLAPRPRVAATLRRLSLANSAQARKRARQAETHRQRNAAQRSAFRTAVKKVIKAIRGGDQAAAAEAYKAAVPIIDRAAGKGLIHANKAARHKSRLNAHIKALA